MWHVHGVAGRAEGVGRGRTAKGLPRCNARHRRARWRPAIGGQVRLSAEWERHGVQQGLTACRRRAVMLSFGP